MFYLLRFGVQGLGFGIWDSKVSYCKERGLVVDGLINFFVKQCMMLPFACPASLFIRTGINFMLV